MASKSDFEAMISTKQQKLLSPLATPQLFTGEIPLLDLDNEPIMVLMSTTFTPSGAVGSNEPFPPNVVFMTTDCVLFYVQAELLHHQSFNNFADLLPDLSSEYSSSVVSVPETSDVLNIILHSAYQLSCARYAPSFPLMEEAVDSMPTYGLSPHTAVAFTTALFSLILAQAPLHPLEAYTLAAKHDLMDLAIPCSSYLLSLDPSTITDSVAVKLGPLYLKRLFFMHLGRYEALKCALLEPPPSHPLTISCGFVEQRKLSVAWSLAAARLAWEGKGNTSEGVLESTMSSLGAHLQCPDCKEALQTRVKSLVSRWSLVKRTI